MTVNSEDYDVDRLTKTANEHDASHLIMMAQYANFYVVTNDANVILGCGGISNYWDVLNEAIILTVFVDPEHEHMGMGHQIMHQLMSDSIFLRSKRVEIPAAIGAVKFYEQFGFAFKNGKSEPDENGDVRMELFRSV